MPQPVSHPAPTEDELAILKAAYAGDLQKAQSLVVNGVNVNVQSNEFYDMGMHRDVTPLMCASANGHLEIVRFLLQHQANPSAETILSKSDGGPGTQAIHLAAAGGYENIVSALLDAGANPNAEGRFGRTPLTCALGEAKLSCAKLLLTRGASAITRSKHKQFDPPVVVLCSGVSNTTSMVLRNGKLVPAGKDFWDQKDALIEVLESLLAAGADPNATGTTGVHPLSLLGRQIPEDISLPLARTLIEHGANPDAVSKSGGSEPAIPSGPASKPEKRHIASDFLTLVNTGEAEWSLLAVKAPFDVVSDAYFKFVKANTRLANVPVRPATDGQEIPALTAIVKLKDSAWTIILHTIFYLRNSHLKHIASAAKELSKLLQARTLTWSGTDETDNGRCELFEKGAKITTANNARSIALLTREDIHVPACYPAREGRELWLAVENPSVPKVERADLIGQ